MALSPTSIPALKLLAKIEYDSLNHESAEQHFLKLIRTDPKGNHSTTFLKLGTIYIKKLQWKNASVVFYNACKIINSSYAWQ